MTDCCEKCRFWSAFGTSGTTGKCRRRSPIISSLGFTNWPIVHLDDWCGEFEMREEVKPCITCGKPSGADGVMKMEHNTIIGRFCKACSEKVKPSKNHGRCEGCGKEGQQLSEFGEPPRMLCYMCIPF